MIHTIIVFINAVFLFHLHFINFRKISDDFCENEQAVKLNAIFSHKKILECVLEFL